MRKMIATTGERLYREAQFKVFLPDNKKFVMRRMRAPARKGITAQQIEQELMALANYLEHKFPQFEYRLVPVGPTKFNFVWVGERAKQEN